MAQEAEVLVVSDSDEEEDGDHGGLLPAGQPRRDRLERIALFDFLRLVAGNREQPVGFRSNEDLVANLKSSDTIQSDALYRAMLACPRDLFVPAAHRGEALQDRPIRVEAAGFNISAPHVQAASLQALGVEPGHRVLDVGCGCGIVTAYAACLAGPSGSVVGVDIRDSAISLATSNLKKLKEQNIEFSEVSAPVVLEHHNVFIPLLRHKGQYDTVHVGGAMPESRVGAILDLLGPRGGRIVAPVSNDLRLITKYPDGTVRQRVLSQVSFSELELPRDVEVVQALQEEREEAARHVHVPPSTFAADLAHLAAVGADLREVAAAAAAQSGVGTPPAAAPPAGAAAASADGGQRPRMNNGVRARSRTSLEEAHLASVTLPPAHRPSGKEGLREAATKAPPPPPPAVLPPAKPAVGTPPGAAAGASSLPPRPPTEQPTATAEAPPLRPRPLYDGGGGGGWEQVQRVQAARTAAAREAEYDSRGGGAGGGGDGVASMEVSGDVEAGGGAMEAEEEVEGRMKEGERKPLAGRGPEGGGKGVLERPVEVAAEVAAAPAGPIDMVPEREGSSVGHASGETDGAAAGAASGAAAGGDGDGGGGLSYLAAASGVLALGPPDCELEGPGWRLQAHRAVLQARCDLLRAHIGSGMRDSDTARYVVPEAVERPEAMEAFLHYVYKDCLPPGGVDSAVMPQLLHAAIYYGCHRLVRLCESLLARELVAAAQAGRRRRAPGDPAGVLPEGGLAQGQGPKQGRGAGAGGSAGPSAQAGAGAGADEGEGDAEVLAAAVEAAGPLLALADEGGLDQLRVVALQFILDHFSAVSATEGYRQLPRPLVDCVAAEAVRRYSGLLGELRSLSGQRGGAGEVDDD